MSLLVAALCAYFTFGWYWNHFAGFNQYDHWFILKGAGLSLLAALLAHRIVWMVLDKIDAPFNNPRESFTRMGRNEVVSVLSTYLNKQGFFNDNKEHKDRGFLAAQKGISLADVNPFFAGSPAVDRGIEKIPGPIGALFRFLGTATWYSGDFSVWLYVSINVYGLDDECTIVKVKFENKASPPVINFWGPFTRFLLFARINSLIKRCEELEVDLDAEVEEPDVAAPAIEVDRSRDYKMPPQVRNIAEFEKLWNESRYGDPITQFRLAEAYHEGVVVARDYAKAIKCYELAAEKNNCDAQYALWAFYRDGIINNASVNRQKYLDLRRMAADAGNPEAMYDMGCLMMEQDRELSALEWFEKAGKLGHIDAMCYAGNIIDSRRKFRSLEKSDPREAAAWFMEASNRGSTIAGLSLAHVRMKDGKVKSALAQYRKAALSGNADAQRNLGYYYLYGDGIEQNLHRAKYWLGKASEQHAAGLENYLEYLDEQLAICKNFMRKAG